MSSKVFGTGLAWAFLAATAIGTAIADPKANGHGGGQLAVLTGSYHVRAPASDDLVDCAQLTPSLVVDTQLVAGALPGVCDNLGTHPCQGDVHVQIQRCLAGGSAIAAGPLAGGHSGGVARICYADPTLGVAGCSASNTVAAGTWTAAASGLPDAIALHGTGVLAIRESQAFAFNSRHVRVPRQASIYQIVSERSSPTPGSCGVTPRGCGFVATGALQ